MNRREVITLLGGAAASAASWPLAARAQPAMPVIGVLSATQPTDRQLRAFQQGLGEVGFVESRNVAIEYRSADGQYDRLPGLAADLVDRKVTVIAALFTPIPARAAKAATKTIPIVFLYGGDPVEDGLVSSLNRPGGNVTGVTFITAALAAKRLELLRDLVPKAAMIGVLINPTNQLAATQLKDLQAGARTLGQPIEVVNASNEGELETRLRGPRPHASRRSPGRHRRVLFQPPRSTRRPGGAPCASRDLLRARGAARRRADELRGQPDRRGSTNRRLHRPHPQGRQAGRSSRRAADQIRVDDQSQDREGRSAWPCRTSCWPFADEVIE